MLLLFLIGATLLAFVAWLMTTGRTVRILRLIVGAAFVAVMATVAWPVLKDYNANLVCEHPWADFSSIQIKAFLESRYVNDPICAIAKERISNALKRQGAI